MKRTVWANALLSDGKILFWSTGNECKSIYDFYKDFYYSGLPGNYEDHHKMELVKKSFEQKTAEDNRMIFDELAPEFYRQWEISEDSKGAKPYKEE